MCFAKLCTFWNILLIYEFVGLWIGRNCFYIFQNCIIHSFGRILNSPAILFEYLHAVFRSLINSTSWFEWCQQISDLSSASYRNLRPKSGRKMFVNIALRSARMMVSLWRFDHGWFFFNIRLCFSNWDYRGKILCENARGVKVGGCSPRPRGQMWRFLGYVYFLGGSIGGEIKLREAIALFCAL